MARRIFIQIYCSNGFPSLNITNIFPGNPSLEAKTSTNFYEAEPDITDIDNDEVINLYPNPSNGLLYISSKDVNKGNVKITIYSVLGQKVFDQELMKSEINEINVSGLRKGTYFVTFTNETRTITKTIIIK